MTDAFYLSVAHVHNSPATVSQWQPTSTLTKLEFRDSGVHVEHSKQNPPNVWPEVVPPGWDGGVQYTLWIGMLINGVWHVSGVIEYWKGLDVNGGNVTADNQIAKNWTYDGDEMARQPNPGELVAFFVTAGDQRKKDVWAVHERSQVVTVPFPASLPATFTFADTPVPVPTPVPDPPPPVPVPVPPAPVPLPPVDLTPILTRLDHIEAALIALAAKQPPVYKGPYGLTLTPVTK